MERHGRRGELFPTAVAFGLEPGNESEETVGRAAGEFQ
jgi:hypothetical protein